MIIDVHTHLCALARGGTTSPSLVNSIAFRYMRYRLGIRGEQATWQDQLEATYLRLVETSGLDRAVLLAFDRVYDIDGQVKPEHSHLVLENRYVAEFCKQSTRILFGASIHPYRKDVVAELERCVRDGAVLVKWLPLTQMMDPASERCIPLYEAMAHHRIPLLCHTGGEKTLHAPDKSMRDPARLELALRRGVTVIAAHCGTPSIIGETSYYGTFRRMAMEYEHLYGDTAGMALPNRSHALAKAADDERIRAKLVHGSDWPVPSSPVIGRTSVGQMITSLREKNWLKRDIEAKRAIGLDDAYFTRASTLLRL